MRLIDADALMERFNQFCEYNCDYTKKQRDIMCSSCGIGCAIDMLDETPTVIPTSEEAANNG